MPKFEEVHKSYETPECPHQPIVVLLRQSLTLEFMCIAPVTIPHATVWHAECSREGCSSLHGLNLLPLCWRTDEGVDGIEASGNRVGAIRGADAHADQVPRSGPIQSVGALLKDPISGIHLKDCNRSSIYLLYFLGDRRSSKGTVRTV